MYIVHGVKIDFPRNIRRDWTTSNFWGLFSQKLPNNSCDSTESPGPAILSAIKIKFPKDSVLAEYVSYVTLVSYRPWCHGGCVHHVHKALDGIQYAGLLPHSRAGQRVRLHEHSDGKEEEQRDAQSGQETWPDIQIGLVSLFI